MPKKEYLLQFVVLSDERWIYLINSSIVSGSFFPLVSGIKKKNNTAEMAENVPYTKNGIGYQIISPFYFVCFNKEKLINISFFLIFIK